MTWETNATTSDFQTDTAANATMTERQAQRSAASGMMNASGATPGFFGLGGSTGYSVVGLNVSAVSGMRESIREYTNRLKTRLSNIDALADASNAFRSNDGSVEKAVSEYIDKVKEYCINLTSDLLAFSDKLGDVKNAWQTATETMASTVQTDTSGAATSTQYQETIQ